MVVDPEDEIFWVLDRTKNQIKDAAQNEKHKYDIRCKLFNSVNAASAELRLVAERTLKTN